MDTLFLLVSITRCVSSNLCPTDDEIKEAVKARDDAEVWALSEQFTQENPDTITLVHTERIRSIADVICGDKLPGDQLAITCRFTIRYHSRNAYQVARLVQHEGKWSIDDALMVTRERSS